MPHAIRIHEYGGPEVLRHEEVERPTPGDDEVLIRVRAAGVNPIDWKIRIGYLEGKISLPTIPGTDLSGVVEAVGGNVRDMFRAGDEVFGMIRPAGTYAEYATASPEMLARKPASLEHEEAAAVPLAALTAWQCLFEQGGLEGGQRVLIHAAAGGIGSFAVQMARNIGARVVGTASAANTDYVTDLGAQHVIDYHTSEFDAVVGQIDLVLDLVGGETQDRSWSVLRKGGVLVSTVGAPSEERARVTGVTGKGMRTRPDGEQLRRIGEDIEAGRIRVPLTEVLPLEKAADAQRASESGHTRGKIVLKVSA